MATLDAYTWVTDDKTNYFANNTEYTFTYLGDAKSITFPSGTEVALYKAVNDAEANALDITLYAVVYFNVDGTTSVSSKLTKLEEEMIEMVDGLTLA